MDSVIKGAALGTCSALQLRATCPGRDPSPGGDERDGGLVGPQEERCHLQVSAPRGRRAPTQEKPAAHSGGWGWGEQHGGSPVDTGRGSTPCALSLRPLVAPTPRPAPPSPMPRSSFVVQLPSQVRLCDPRDCSVPGSLSSTLSRSLLKLMSIDSVMPSSHLILCRPLLLPSLMFPSIRVFFFPVSQLFTSGPKYWSFSFSISPSNEHSGLISFRIDWLDLLAVQGTLKSLLQHHSSMHQFFGAQLSSQSNSHIHTWPVEKPYP